jgi:hypothetical protein
MKPWLAGIIEELTYRTQLVLFFLGIPHNNSI